LGNTALVKEEAREAATAATNGHAPLSDGSVDEAPAIKPIEGTYDANKLGVLKGLEAVRMRPSMYIGDTGVRGLHHLFVEILDNSIDEVLAGHCDQILVTLGKDNIVTVTDNGRGIPVDVNAQTGRTGVELVMTELHAGGKFGGGGYKSARRRRLLRQRPIGVAGDGGSPGWQDLPPAVRAGYPSDRA
jgi:hypothetical protein